MPQRRGAALPWPGHATLDFFYAFVRTVLSSTRLKRDSGWLREILARDAPGLSAEAVGWYCERFDVVLDISHRRLRCGLMTAEFLLRLNGLT